TTGFNFFYFNRLHTGATAWAVFAQLGFNPYYQTVAQTPTAAPLAVGADAGGGPNVKVYDPATGAVLANFFAYAANFTGGVTVAAGDVDNDGRADIVTGAGPGGGPHVRVFSGANPAQVLIEFFAYAPNFGGGVFVAAGDTNCDAKADIITGAGPGGGPQV